MGLFRKIGSTISGIFGNRKRGTTEDAMTGPSSGLIESKGAAPDSFDVRKQFQVQRAEEEARRGRAEKAERYAPGFFKSYVQWAAWRTRQKLRGTIPKDFDLTVQQYQKELAKLKSDLQRKELLERNQPTGYLPGMRPRQPQQRGPHSTPTRGRPSTDLERFLSGEFVPVTSSNVAEIAYQAETSTLRIIFHDENEYIYQPIHPKHAENFFFADSKGTWVWDNLRIRGTALGHKVPYAHVAGHGDVQRKWIQSDEKIVAHHSQVESESKAYKGSKGDVIIAMVPGALIED